MHYDSQAPSWPATLQALALVVNPRLGLRHGLMKVTLSLFVHKHQAHCALLGRPQFVELCLAYREANGRVKKAIIVDAYTFM